MKKTNNTLHFIITGGTIDSFYDTTQDTCIPYQHSVIPKFIEILKLYEECKFTEVCMKDSRDITQKDREQIVETVESSKSKRIIITHGTYTLPKTAKYLKRKITKFNKVIIFVCSMIPLAGFNPTDAGFNLGFGIAESRNLEPGVYVCMNGKIFDPEEVIKIISEGRFASKYTK